MNEFTVDVNLVCFLESHVFSDILYIWQSMNQKVRSLFETKNPPLRYNTICFN